MSERKRFELPPRVEVTAMPTDEELRIMEMYNWGRHLTDDERSKYYRVVTHVPAPGARGQAENETEERGNG